MFLLFDSNKGQQQIFNQFGKFAFWRLMIVLTLRSWI